MMKKVENQIELPMPISHSADNLKVMVMPSNVGQPPGPKEPQNGPAPISAPVDPIAQMKTIVAAETEKCLNSMKELLAKQGPTINGKNKAANQDCQTQNGNHNNPCSRWGQGRQNASGQVQCYNCQGYGHMAKECQNPKVPQGGGKQAPAPSIQGLNAYMHRFLCQCNILSQCHSQLYHNRSLSMYRVIWHPFSRQGYPLYQ